MIIKEGQERTFEDALSDIMVSLNRMVSVSDNYYESLIKCDDIWRHMCKSMEQENFIDAFVIFIIAERNIDIRELREEELA